MVRGHIRVYFSLFPASRVCRRLACLFRCKLTMRCCQPSLIRQDSLQQAGLVMGEGRNACPVGPSVESEPRPSSWDLDIRCRKSGLCLVSTAQAWNLPPATTGMDMFSVVQVQNQQVLLCGAGAIKRDLRLCVDVPPRPLPWLNPRHHPSPACFRLVVQCFRF